MLPVHPVKLMQDNAAKIEKAIASFFTVIPLGDLKKGFADDRTHRKVALQRSLHFGYLRTSGLHWLALYQSWARMPMIVFQG